MREVKAIAVYAPEDKWQSAIQDAAKELTGDWLSCFPCQLLAKAVASLKVGTDWLVREDLLAVRAHYLFAPFMVPDKQSLVFVTHLLYLRDILENGEISSSLHDPIVFMTGNLAKFLFRDSPVHIHISTDLLRSVNPKAKFLDVGGLLICYEGNIELGKSVLDVEYHGSEMNKERTSVLVNDIQQRQGISFSKAAAQEIAPDVFKIEEHFPEIVPNTEVWDKLNRSKAKVTAIEPSENGIVGIVYDNGDETTVPKQEFDQQFVVASRKIAQSNPMEAALISRGVQGDDLLNALDLADSLSEKNADISPDGIVTLYHRTSPDNAQNIVQTGTMNSREDRMFFGTRPDGAISGYGDAVVQVRLPLERLELNDVFPDEACVTMRSGRIGTAVPVEGRLFEVPNGI